MPERDFSGTFDALKALLQPFAADLVTVRDDPGDFYLDTAHVMKNGKPLFFGSVRTGRAYVSYHLMPVYVWPEMLKGVSDGLRGRMQGKSCFNFKTVDEAAFGELEELTRRGFERYREAGYLA
jgi:hypothetical protein